MHSGKGIFKRTVSKLAIEGFYHLRSKDQRAREPREDDEGEPKTRKEHAMMRFSCFKIGFSKEFYSKMSHF